MFDSPSNEYFRGQHSVLSYSAGVPCLWSHVAANCNGMQEMRDAVRIPLFPVVVFSNALCCNESIGTQRRHTSPDVTGRGTRKDRATQQVYWALPLPSPCVQAVRLHALARRLFSVLSSLVFVTVRNSQTKPQSSQQTVSVGRQGGART